MQERRRPMVPRGPPLESRWSAMVLESRWSSSVPVDPHCRVVVPQAPLPLPLRPLLCPHELDAELDASGMALPQDVAGQADP